MADGLVFVSIGNQETEDRAPVERGLFHERYNSDSRCLVIGSIFCLRASGLQATGQSRILSPSTSTTLANAILSCFLQYASTSMPGCRCCHFRLRTPVQRTRGQCLATHEQLYDGRCCSCAEQAPVGFFYHSGSHEEVEGHRVCWETLDIFDTEFDLSGSGM